MGTTRRRMAAFLFGAVLAVTLAGPLAARPPEAAGDWLLLVRSDNIDAAREDAFNAWYDDIDIPDVLAIDGYVRARRGVRVEDPRETPGPGRHLALYDIRTASIDRAILDMLMGAREMAKAGRSSDLLRVVEGVYYRRHLSAGHGQPSPAGQGEEYLLLTGIDGRAGAASDRTIAEWFGGVLAKSSEAGLKSPKATLFRKYRVLTNDVEDPAEYALVIEFRAISPDAALENARRLTSAFPANARPSSLYRKTKEVAKSRPTAHNKDGT